ncbi:MAG: transcriptional regulator, AraC family [Hyphomicrobiales bacterium]|nr:transcriptional regulator, AraC family [Hyphomicrobiales bacterium]
MDTAARDDERWRDIQARRAALQDDFVYAVQTTGVFCRPSCPARRPRRENVSFFADATAAAAAGFRACLRCRPDAASPTASRAELVTHLCRMIDEAEHAPTLARLAQASGVSAFHLQRVFKQATGLTPRQYAQGRRAGRMRNTLAAAGTSVTQAIYEAGFGSGAGFYEQADRMLGMTPRAFRSGGENTTIRYATTETSLGALLAAVSERGVCAITLGDDPATLVADLRERFPRAALLTGDDSFDETVRQVVSFVENPRAGLALPLDLHGTLFQQRVWQALMAIPLGETRSYTQVATEIGAPSAVRAVATACAANKLAVAVPCHRVVRHDGGLSGYRWGVERKRRLLEREKP